MKSNANVMNLRADVRNIRCTSTGDMIIKLKRVKTCNCSTYKFLAEKVLGSDEILAS